VDDPHAPLPAAQRAGEELSQQLARLVAAQAVQVDLALDRSRRGSFRTTSGPMSGQRNERAASVSTATRRRLVRQRLAQRGGLVAAALQLRRGALRAARRVRSRRAA
jgi:hypothetical protein